MQSACNCVTMSTFKFYSTFVWIAVTILCSAQLYYIYDKFFSYETATDVLINYPQKYTIPNLAICTPQNKLMFHIVHRRNLSMTWTQHWLLTAADVIKLLVGNYRTPFTDQTFNPAIITVGHELALFLKKDNVCFDIQVNKWLQSVVDSIPLERDNVLVALRNQISLNSTDYAPLTNIEINAHSPRTQFFCDGGAAITKDVPLGKGIEMKVTFSRIESHRLPWPYKSNCFNYTATSDETQSTCYSNCVVKKSGETYGMIPNTAFVANAPYPRVAFSINPNNRVKALQQENFTRNFPHIVKRCSRHCQQVDCHSDDYVLDLVAVEEKYVKDGATSSRFSIAIMRPARPDMRVIEKPIINWIDFVTYSLSTIGFWFAFSPLTFFTDKVRNVARHCVCDVIK